MIEDVSVLQNQPSRDWAIQAIDAFNAIPLLDVLTEVPRYAAYGLRLLHIAAYEFPDFTNSSFDLAESLNSALLQAAPRICEAAPTDLSSERVYACLGAAGALVRPPIDERDEHILLTSFLRARMDAQVLWNEIQRRGDTLMRDAVTLTAIKYASFAGGKYN